MSAEGRRFLLILEDGYSKDRILQANDLEEMAEKIEAKAGINGDRRHNGNGNGRGSHG